MPTYRIVFANNSIVSCEEDKQTRPPASDIYYEKDRLGRLMFAYIKAEDLLHAVVKANELIGEPVKSAE